MERVVADNVQLVGEGAEALSNAMIRIAELEALLENVPHLSIYGDVVVARSKKHSIALCAQLGGRCAALI